MIATILTFVSHFALAVGVAGVSVMAYALNFFSRGDKDRNSIYIVGLIYAIAGIALIIACEVF